MHRIRLANKTDSAHIRDAFDEMVASMLQPDAEGGGWSSRRIMFDSDWDWIVIPSLVIVVFTIISLCGFDGFLRCDTEQGILGLSYGNVSVSNAGHSHYGS